MITDTALKQATRECVKRPDLRFVVAGDRVSRKRAYKLAYELYNDSGLMDDDTDGMVISPFDTGSKTFTLIAEDEKGTALGTVSLVFDTEAGLPCDEIYGKKLGGLRARGRRIAEVTRLAVRKGLPLSKDVLVGLFNLIYIYAARVRGYTDFVIEVNPRHVPYYERVLLFDQFGELRYCPRVNDAPAILARLDLAVPVREVRRVAGQDRKEKTLYPKFWAYEEEEAIADYLERAYHPMQAEEANHFGLRSPESKKCVATKRKRVLFIGEAVTMAHVIRPLGIARRLDREAYSPVLACEPRHEAMVRNEGVEWVPLHSIPGKTFTRRLMQGAPLYTLKELQSYVREDLKTIAAVRPDVIVGDFRISMGLSAQLAGVPYMALSNAHWSPSLDLPVPTPDHVLLKIIGLRAWGWLFRALMPFFSKLQAKAINRLRRSYGLAPVRGGAPEVYTYGDHTLYLDIPELYDAEFPGVNETCIGPVLWAPDQEEPAWWNDLPTNRPVVFMSAGSSGNGTAMMKAIRAVRDSGATVIVVTAGRMDPRELPSGVYATDFISGLKAAARANLFICNGGSGLVYQALAKGKPVLGIPTNLDQFLVMDAVQRKGAGKILRGDEITAKRVRSVVADLLTNPAYAEAAQRLKARVAVNDPVVKLESVLSRIHYRGHDERAHHSVPVDDKDVWRVSEAVQAALRNECPPVGVKA